MEFDFSQTYLYKMHRLTNSLDAAFDKQLRAHAGIGLSQFTLLLSVQHGQPVTQRQVASFLMISPGAVSRQVEIAQKNGWIAVSSSKNDRRRQQLSLTDKGAAMITTGITALEKHLFSIFDDDNRQTNLMDHIDTLQRNINGI